MACIIGRMSDGCRGIRGGKGANVIGGWVGTLFKYRGVGLQIFLFRDLYFVIYILN